MDGRLGLVWPVEVEVEAAAAGGEGSSTRPQQLVRVDPGCTGSDAPPSLTTQPSLLLLQPSTACEPQSKQIVLLSEM